MAVVGGGGWEIEWKVMMEINTAAPALHPEHPINRLSNQFKD